MTVAARLLKKNVYFPDRTNKTLTPSASGTTCLVASKLPGKALAVLFLKSNRTVGHDALFFVHRLRTCWRYMNFRHHYTCITAAKMYINYSDNLYHRQNETKYRPTVYFRLSKK